MLTHPYEDSHIYFGAADVNIPPYIDANVFAHALMMCRGPFHQRVLKFKAAAFKYFCYNYLVL